MRLLLILISTLACQWVFATSLPKAAGGKMSYTVAGKKHVGYIASGAKPGEKKPGVIIVHEWWGHNAYVQNRADMLAKEGFVAMAIDMYGEGLTADHPKDAGAFSQQAMANFPLAKKRFMKAVEILKKRRDVDGDKIVAIGYCFGGGVVLNMARAGVDLDLIASFHGSLLGKTAAKSGVFKGKILVFNGAADPFVKATEIAQFKSEMTAAKVDFEFFNYKDAVHAFTNKEANEYGKKFKLPLAYHAKADHDSWAKFIGILKNI